MTANWRRNHNNSFFASRALGKSDDQKELKLLKHEQRREIIFYCSLNKWNMIPRRIKTVKLCGIFSVLVIFNRMEGNTTWRKNENKLGLYLIFNKRKIDKKKKTWINAVFFSWVCWLRLVFFSLLCFCI